MVADTGNLEYVIFNSLPNTIAKAITVLAVEQKFRLKFTCPTGFRILIDFRKVLDSI